MRGRVQMSNRPFSQSSSGPNEQGIIGNAGINLTKRRYRTNNILDKKERQPGVQIVDVWAHNLHEEMYRIMDLVDDFNHIAMVRFIVLYRFYLVRCVVHMHGVV